jgi:hypothetical protein
MDRTTVLWTIVAFFGASIAFAMLNRATEDSSRAVALGAQVALLAVIVGAIVLVIRRMR